MDLMGCAEMHSPSWLTQSTAENRSSKPGLNTVASASLAIMMRAVVFPANIGPQITVRSPRIEYPRFRASSGPAQTVPRLDCMGDRSGRPDDRVPRPAEHRWGYPRPRSWAHRGAVHPP